MMSNDDNDVFKSPQTRLRFGKSPKNIWKKEKKRKRNSPSQNSPNNSLNQTIVDLHPEDIYNFQSLSTRLSEVEKENERLKQNIVTLGKRSDNEISKIAETIFTEVISVLTNQENIFEGVKESITAINIEINGFKNVDKSNEINYAGHTINYGKSPNIVTSSDNQLSYANIVKKRSIIQKIADKKIQD